MKYHLLLLEDVINHGKKGDVVYVAPGYARNFLLPKRKAVLATKDALKMRKKLQEERQQQAQKEKELAESLAHNLDGACFETVVKVNPIGHMYGSVTSIDVVEILSQSGHSIDKRWVFMPNPIKMAGTHKVLLNLPEGVKASIDLTVKPDQEIDQSSFFQNNDSESVTTEEKGQACQGQDEEALSSNNEE